MRFGFLQVDTARSIISSVMDICSIVAGNLVSLPYSLTETLFSATVTPTTKI
jgi:hypothetical protein